MKVSIIILNYNTSRLTLNCINSIHKYLPNGTYEIIVVDNASQETDYQHLTENLSGQEITIIRNKINSGFGAGNMVGANIAQGKYLCFLNNDTELLEDCISPLCSYLKENPQTGCITPQQYNKHLKAVPSSNRYSIWDFRKRHPGKIMSRPLPQKKKESIPVSYTCFMDQRSIYDVSFRSLLQNQRLWY